MIRWAFFLIVAGLMVGYTVWVYRNVELAVRGVRLLAWVRAITLVLIAALLFDLQVRDTDASGAPDRWVLLDASLSMSAGGDDPSAPWPRALTRAQELADEGWRVVTFGDGLGSEGVPRAGPLDTRTLLAPALERAAESGSREVLVLSDTRFGDAVAVRGAVATLPIRVDFEVFGVDLVNAGISRFDVTDVPHPGQPATAEIEVHGAPGPDSLTLELREEERLVGSWRVATPPAGLRRRVDVELPSPEVEGRVRYTAAIALPGDGFPTDDTAVAYATVGHEEGALVLVSLRPDWEPRFLLPVLGEVTGLPARGFLRVGADRFVTMGRAVDRGARVDSAAVRAAAADAALLVVHGLDVDADEWARGIARRAGRALLWVRDVEGAELVGVGVRPPDSGEWYASSDIPASPLAGDLAGLQLLGLPPLTGVLTLQSPVPGTVPLRVQLRGAGPGQAALHLGSSGGARRVVVLASGFWRWAVREGAARDAYRSLWSGVAGWLLADPGPAGAEVRPAVWVIDRDAVVEWRVPGDSADVIQLTVLKGDSAVSDTAVAGGASLSTGPYPPGTYRFSAESADGSPVGEGRFDVQAATAEMAHAPRPPSVDGGASAADGPWTGAARPLRTSPWPYLLVIVLLCAEWVGRRRIGLR